MSRASVVITCYNQEEYIGAAIESVVQQTRYDAIVEIIVVDDGSTDDSEVVIQGWADRCEKIHYCYQENQGVSAARNEGIRRSSADYIAFLDGDDLWCEDRLKHQLKSAKEHPDVGLFYGDVYSFEGDPSDRTRGYCSTFEHDDEDVLPKLYLHGAPILLSTTLINCECFRTVGLFDPRLRRGQDTDMWLRIASAYPIQHIPRPLVLKRQHEESLGADIEKKAHSLLSVTDKIADRYPELDPLRRRRKAKIRSGLSRNRLVSGNRAGAVKSALNAIALDPLTMKHHATLGFALLPFSSRQLRWIRGRIQGAKRKMNRWLWS
jgi:glycosyltransferase involved in cell wall biosynthesis